MINDNLTIGELVQTRSEESSIILYCRGTFIIIYVPVMHVCVRETASLWLISHMLTAFKVLFQLHRPLHISKKYTIVKTSAYSHNKRCPSAIKSNQSKSMAENRVFAFLSTIQCFT